MLPLLPMIGAVLAKGLSGSSDPLEAQRQFSEMQEWRAAAASMLKIQTDTTNGITAGILESSNKSMSAMFSSARGISY